MAIWEPHGAGPREDGLTGRKVEVRQNRDRVPFDPKRIEPRFQATPVTVDELRERNIARAQRQAKQHAKIFRDRGKPMATPNEPVFQFAPKAAANDRQPQQSQSAPDVKFGT
jgi:hypothetical protein